MAEDNKSSGDEIKSPSATISFLEKIADPDSGQPITFRVIKAFVTENGGKHQVTKEQIIKFAVTIGGLISDDQLDESLGQLIENRIVKELKGKAVYELVDIDSADWIFQKITRYESGLVKVSAFIDYAFDGYQQRSSLLNEQDLNHIRLFERGLHLEEAKDKFLQKSKKTIQRKKLMRKIELSIGIVIILALSFYVILAYSENNEELIAAGKARVNAEKSVSNQSTYEAQTQKAIAKAAAAEENLKKAVLLADSARLQAEQANKNARNAYYRARVANEQRDETERQRLLEEEARKKADSLTAEAQRALIESDRQVALATAVTLAYKSIDQRTQPLKSQMALQAYELYKVNDGYVHNSAMYNALYYSTKSLMGDDYNVMIGHNVAKINQITIIDGEYHTTGDDGHLLIWKDTAGGFKPRIIEEKFIYYWKDGKINIIESSLSSYSIKYLAVNNNRSFVNTGSNHFIQIDRSTDEMFDVVLEDFKGKLLKIFPVTVGWHVISNSQLIHITAEDENQRLAITYPFEMKIIDVIESKNGYYLLGAEQIYNFDIETKEVAVVDLPIGVHPTAFNASDDLKELAVGYASGTIDLFDLNSKSLIGQLGDHTSRVTTILFSSNREHLVSAGLDRVVNIWNMAELKKEPIQFGDHDSFITALHYNDSTNLLMVGEVNGTLKYYNLNNDLQIQQLCNEEPGSLSREEWNRYIGNHIKYDPYSCNSTSLNTGLYYEAK